MSQDEEEEKKEEEKKDEEKEEKESFVSTYRQLEGSITERANLCG